MAKRAERDKVVHVRTTPADKRAIEQAAERRGVSLTEYVRTACLSPTVLALNPYALEILAGRAVGEVLYDAVMEATKPNRAVTRLGSEDHEEQ